MLLTRAGRGAIGLVAHIIQTDLTRPDETMEKTRIKGITEFLKYSNGLELQFHDQQLHGYFSDMSGDTLRRFFAQRVGLIASSERADWDINDVFNDSTTQEVNWHRHM